jgi:pimeloyl-ACP methyl ester carboxylesterase
MRFAAAIACLLLLLPAGSCAVSVDARRLAPQPQARPVSAALAPPPGYRGGIDRVSIVGVGAVEVAYLHRREARGLLIYSGGRGFRLERASARAARLAELTGANLLLYNYPGRGASEGVSDAATLAALAKGLRALPAVHDAGPVLIYGFSFGGLMAALLAAAGPTDGVVIEASSDAADAVAERLLPLPLRWALDVNVTGESLPYAERLVGADAPILVLAGGRDAVAPPPIACAFAQKLARMGGDVRFAAAPGAAHGKALYTEEGGAALRRFTEEVQSVQSTATSAPIC